MQEKAVIYCRLSKEDGDKVEKDNSSESIQNQKLLLIEHAIKNGWQIHEIYTDDDYSGLDRDRPAFNKMLEDAEQGKFNIILCKNQSRFSRDIEVVEQYLHNQFIAWNIRFIGIVDNVDTGVKGGKKARQINSLVNEWYSEDLSANVTAALNAMKQNGLYVGHLCIYGYKRDPNNKHKLIIDREAAEVVREIFDLYLKGYGIAAIANILTKKRYKTPTEHKRAQGKNYYNPAEKKAIHGEKNDISIWSTSTIRKILRERIYLGHMVQGREKKVSYKSKKMIKVPEKDWIVVKNTHERIINVQTFDKVQSRLGVKSSNIDLDKEKAPKTHLFAGKVICLECKSTMQKRYGRNKVQYLKCGLALKTKNDKCSLHTIRMDTLTAAVKDALCQIVKEFIKDDAQEVALMSIVNRKNSLRLELTKEQHSLTEVYKKQQEASDTLANVYVDKVKGVLSEVEFKVIKERLGIDMEHIKERVSKTQEAIKQLENKIKNEEKNPFKIRDYIEHVEMSYAAVTDFIDYIEIGDKYSLSQTINIHWIF